jgi:DNA-binding NarL/FixJ family response regulator
MHMPRILVADDHMIVRRQVRKILEREHGWDVCAEAASGREAVAMTAAHRPDIVVLDVSMPDLNGLQAAREIHEQFPEIKMIILSMHDPFELIDELKEFGVHGWILKTDLPQLVEEIRNIWQLTRQVTIEQQAATHNAGFHVDVRKNGLGDPPKLLKFKSSGS